MNEKNPLDTSIDGDVMTIHPHSETDGLMGGRTRRNLYIPLFHGGY